MADKKVLVVDDDAKTVELVKLYLNRDGYQVLTAYDGAEALRLAREGYPDLVVLDLMLPDIDGLSVCRTLRRESDVPIIMLTARTTDQDKLAGLDIGADDYVTKPFSPKELAARVRAVLRRLPGQRGPEEIKTGRLSMNLVTHEALFGGRPLNLTSVEFRLLAILAKEPGRVFSRSSLIEEALGYDFEGFDRTVDVHILNLRRKLESDPSHPKYIKTVYGVGYKFVGGEQ
jgi:two-component system alkaline phosphatase synthesis response regulator PhoP